MSPDERDNAGYTGHNSLLLACQTYRKLKISMAGFFGDRIVRPHLAEFKALYPEMKLEFSHSRKIVDFSTTPFHSAIIYGEGTRKGLHSIPICNERTAVCTPGLVAGLETQHPDARILAFADWLKSVVARIQAG